MHYGTRLREYIDKSMWNQSEVAGHLGVPKTTLGGWLRQEYPKLENIEKVCKILGISLGEFFDDQGAYELLRVLREVVK